MLSIYQVKHIPKMGIGYKPIASFKFSLRLFQQLFDSNYAFPIMLIVVNSSR